MASAKTVHVFQKSISSRYRGLIWSVAVFLTLIALLMVSSIWLSAKIRNNTMEQLAVEQVNSATQVITQNLFNLKLSYGEDPNSPHIRHALDVVKQSKDHLNANLVALTEGGTVETQEGSKFKISALTQDGNAQRLQQFKNDWEPLSRQIDTYLAEATSPLADSSSLDLSVMGAQNINEKLQANVNGVLSVINGKITARTAWLGWIQTIGVVIALAYFLVFVFYFLSRLRDSDVRVEAARKETDEIMNTVSTGLFLLDKDLNIGSQYSKELESLIGQNELAGRNLMEVLGNMISQEDLNTTHGFIGQLYNPRVKERLIGSLNPLTRQAMNITDRNGNPVERYLDFKFNRVYQDNDISRILVNVSDVTDAVLLERKIEEEREQNDLQLEMLSTILRADRQMIDDFIRNTHKHNISINNTLKTPGERQVELRSKIEHIFREAHSLKGEAYALNLHGFTVIAENIENELKKLQAQSSLSGENFLGLAVHLEELMNLTQTIEDLVSRLGHGEPIGTPQTPAAGKARMTDYYARLVSDVAERNNKVVDFSYSGVGEVPDEGLRTTIHEIAVQLLRNAVVHGIEAPAVRQSKRKLEAGHVRMELRETENSYVLRLEDDGNGIDYDAIRNKAVEMGKYSAERAASLSTKELLMLMFSSGFSTVAKAIGDAGRGVGLDVIKDRVNALGGKINVSTSAGAYTRFTFTFPKKAV
ncbi:ATP-binding protein [Conchiformibius kuhniae]|uniref:Chemotaxis protein CheA n=1 Tax=Conchiformibius kuhniae TaxID=211502 RepID=A0A8T9MUL1_9NEIS|nr:ATP-binding protein [Conchiformibius kuhniae]